MKMICDKCQQQKRLRLSDLKSGEGMILRNTIFNRAIRQDIKEGELYIDVKISETDFQEFKLKEIYY